MKTKRIFLCGLTALFSAVIFIAFGVEYIAAGLTEGKMHGIVWADLADTMAITTTGMELLNVSLIMFYAACAFAGILILAAICKMFVKKTDIINLIMKVASAFLLITGIVSFVLCMVWCIQKSGDVYSYTNSVGSFMILGSALLGSIFGFVASRKKI